MDFGYAPYSLGDTMTWLTNLQITAHRHRCTKIDIVIVARPERPSSGLQRFITPHNYVQALETLFPAFLCAPMVRSIRVFERFRSFSQRIVGAIVARTHSWPSLVSPFREELDYSSHRQINKFSRLRIRHRKVPPGISRRPRTGDRKYPPRRAKKQSRGAATGLGPDLVVPFFFRRRTPISVSCVRHRRRFLRVGSCSHKAPKHHYPARLGIWTRCRIEPAAWRCSLHGNVKWFFRRRNVQ